MPKASERVDMLLGVNGYHLPGYLALSDREEVSRLVKDLERENSALRAQLEERTEDDAGLGDVDSG